jgi:hypothetical protein
MCQVQALYTLHACYDESSCPLLRSNSATRARIAARRSSPNVRASARACARLADAARCRASGIVCNENNAGAKPSTMDCRLRHGGSQCERKEEDSAHYEANDDNQLVLPCIVCSAREFSPRCVSWCSTTTVCLALCMLTSSAGKLGGVHVICAVLA